MIRKFFAGLGLAASLMLSIPAQAAEPVAVATVDLNLRAGPGTNYPVVATIPRSASVTVHGCVAGYSWCDVNYGASRGWVAAAYLQTVYRGRPVALTAVVAPRIGVRVVVFDRTYWTHHYVGRPFYRNWNVYVVR